MKVRGIFGCKEEAEIEKCRKSHDESVYTFISKILSDENK
jgi:hypothetical protein